MFSLSTSEVLVLGSIALDWWQALFVKAGEEQNPLLKNNKIKIKTKEQTKYLHGYNVTESKRKTPGPYNLIESKVLRLKSSH